MKKRFNINLDDTAFVKERTPPRPQFQPSFKGGENTSGSAASSAKAASEPVERPFSYADYIVQSKRTVAAPAQTERCSKLLQKSLCESDPVSSASGRCEGEGGSEGDKKSEDPQVTGTHQKEGNGHPRSDPSPSLGPKPVGSGSSIIVSPRQRGNPILKFVRTVPWEFGDVAPDYVLGQTTCALFLSLRYHNLNPNYIHDRLKQLGHTFILRVLLVQVDVKDPHHTLKELARICIMADCTLILAWSPEEAGRYLETYKSYEKKPADLLKEQVEKNYLSKKESSMPLRKTWFSVQASDPKKHGDSTMCSTSPSSSQRQKTAEASSQGMQRHAVFRGLKLFYKRSCSIKGKVERGAS
uniref:ERCC1-like central domain-containing protein n=1 Tax=Gasterosteus aculeatus aculeatus TaxID=481459 RepID=A0AAQ4RP02_GASAC